MKKLLALTLGLAALGALAVLSGPAAAATSAPGPYYATPSWDQTLPAATRFIVLTNMSSQAVLDRETGLVWEQSPSTRTFYWMGAQEHCNQLGVGNRRGWHLPTIQELASLIDPARFTPALPAGQLFSNVQSSIYWSATTLARDASSAWVVSLSNGGVGVHGKAFSLFVWCVRGGQGVDPP